MSTVQVMRGPTACPSQALPAGAVFGPPWLQHRPRTWRRQGRILERRVLVGQRRGPQGLVRGLNVPQPLSVVPREAQPAAQQALDAPAPAQRQQHLQQGRGGVGG